MINDNGFIISTLLDHQRKTGIRDMRAHCMCGWVDDNTARDLPNNAHTEHVAEQIKAVVVENVSKAVVNEVWSWFDAELIRMPNARSTDMERVVDKVVRDS